MTTTELTDLTNGSVVNSEWTGTGVFDILIGAVNKNIEIQYQKGRITGGDYAQVYLGGVQAVLQQSIQWVLQADTSAAQVDDIRKGIELKSAQMEGIGYDNQVKAEQVRMTQFEREFIQPKQLEEVEAKIVSMEKDNLVKEEQVKMSVFEREFVQPAQLDKLQKEIEVSERQVVIQESKLTDDLLTSAKQRTILDTEEQAKQYEVDNILPANLAVLEKQDDEIQTKIELMTQQKLTEVEQTRGANATADKVEYEVSDLLPLQKSDAEEVIRLRHTERVLKDKQAAMLGLDNVVKNKEAERLTNPTAVYTPQYEVI